MEFHCYYDWKQLPQSATAIFAQAEKNSIFLSRPWFETLAASIPSDQTLLLACVEENESLLALLPLVKNKAGNYHALKHRYTPRFSLLLSDEKQEQVLSCLARGLAGLPVSIMQLEPVLEGDNGVDAFQQALQQENFYCGRSFRHFNWIYRLQGKRYAEYIAERPARLKNTIVRKQRKLQREHGCEFRMYIGNDVPAAMPDYYAPYTASWKANEQYMEFLDNMVEVFSRQGWSRLGVLYVKKQPIAAQLWFVHEGKASIFRLAYDEAWKKYSPGSLLTRYMMEYVIDIDRVDEIDFLTGNDAYKQDWMTERREYQALICEKRIKPVSVYKRVISRIKSIFNHRI